MTINFFKKELDKLRTRFNETFGETQTCNLKLRQAALVAIIWLGVSEKRINEAPVKNLVRKEIKEFIRARDVLNNLFNRLQDQQSGRRELQREIDIGPGIENLPCAQEHYPGTSDLSLKTKLNLRR